MWKERERERQKTIFYFDFRWYVHVRNVRAMKNATLSLVSSESYAIQWVKLADWQELDVYMFFNGIDSFFCKGKLLIF